jgi:hypothetical protein
MLQFEEGTKFKFEFKDSDDEIDEAKLGDVMTKKMLHLDEMKSRRAAIPEPED